MDTSDPQPRRPLPLNIGDVEMAFDVVTPSYGMSITDAPSPLLDLVTGRIVWPNPDEDSEAYWGDPRFLAVPTDEPAIEFRDLEAFIRTLPDGPRRHELSEVVQGRGAFRRFRDIVHGSGDIELRHAWHWFETRRRREHIVAWLEDAGIEPQWDCDIFQPPTLPNRRPDLLRAVLDFVRRARQLAGVERIALLGSLATDKAHPKDVDLLVVVDDTVPLGPLAKCKRQLLAKTMATGDSRGADVFLANRAGEYIGRVCQWKECRPGIRQSCQAQHCGRREFLYDDLQNIRLASDLIARPPIELWPNPGPPDPAVAVPQDVAELLLLPLQTPPPSGSSSTR